MLGIFWITSATVPLMAVDPDPYVLDGLLGAAGLLAPTANTILVSYVVAVTPDRLQGRVDAAGNFVTGVATPVAPVATGLLFASLGGPGALLVIAAAMAVVTVATTASPAIRHLPRLEQLVAQRPASLPEPERPADRSRPAGGDGRPSAHRGGARLLGAPDGRPTPLVVAGSGPTQHCGGLPVSQGAGATPGLLTASA